MSKQMRLRTGRLTVMILENAPMSLRGELSQWLQEVRAGVFVGHVTTRIRDKLWDKCIKSAPASGIIQIWPGGNNDQKYQVRSNGPTSRDIIDYDGIKLVQIRHDLDKKAGGSKLKARLKRMRDTAISDGQNVA